MSVSVVIPHYGNAAPTAALVAQLVSQLDATDEIIVVDDCSPDLCPEIDGARVVRRPRNGGFGSTCNSGAAVASGDLLLFLNSDLSIPPGFVAGLVAAAAPFQPCVAGPAIVDEQGIPDYSARHFPTIAHQVAEWTTVLARWRGTRLGHELVGHDTSAMSTSSAAATDWIVGAVLLVPRAEFAAVGGFDESFYMNSEEVDLQRRLRDRGVPSIFMPDIFVVHLGGGASDPAKRRAWVVDSRRTYARKWGGRRRLQASLTAVTAVNLTVNTVRRVAGRPVRPLKTARDELNLIWGEETR